MGLIDRFIKTEKRSLENPNIPVSADDFLHIMGWGNYSSAAGITVNTDNALGVPAVWAAVNFISGTLASLPLEVHRRTDVGFELVRDGVGAWLDRAVNPTLSSFAWRKYIFEQVLTGGRAVTLIVRNGAGTVTDLVPLDTSNLHVYETNDCMDCQTASSSKSSNGTLFTIDRQARPFFFSTTWVTISSPSSQRYSVKWWFS